MHTTAKEAFATKIVGQNMYKYVHDKLNKIIICPESRFGCAIVMSKQTLFCLSQCCQQLLACIIMLVCVNKLVLAGGRNVHI